MNPSHDALLAFACACECGSFSAAARRLGKSQSTISETIANLEIDLGCQLFDRSGRQPVPTEAGRRLLHHAQRVLAAGDALRLQAGLLQQGQESRLTLVLSDTYQSNAFRETIQALERRYPQLELECLVGEDEDVIELIRHGRAQLGFIAAQPGYPVDMACQTLAETSQIGLYAAKSHPLASLTPLRQAHLAEHRQLRLNTYVDKGDARGAGRCWSAPSYLLLLEMACMGAGWAALPRWLAQAFGGDKLCELNLPGWPREQAVDLLWSRRQPLGMAACWLVERLTK